METHWWVNTELISVSVSLTQGLAGIFWKSIWRFLVIHGRRKTSSAMKLDMERNLVGMSNFFFLMRRQMKANPERMIPEHNRHCITPRQATCILELRTRGPACYSLVLGETLLSLASWDYRYVLGKSHSNPFSILQTAEMLLQQMKQMIKTWS